MARLDDVKASLVNCQNSLQKHFDIISADKSVDDETLKLRDEYFKWVDLKTTLICAEKNYALPCDALPNKISEYLYKYLYQDKRGVVDKYYKKDDKSGTLVINIAKRYVPQNDVDILIHNLILKRGNVIWVNFGFNIGSEFGGKHPALILKNTQSAIFVLPLSSQQPSNPDVNVEIERVHGLPQRTRWGNVLRIVPISILRVDFSSPVGDVKGSILNDISSKIKSHGIK